MRENRTYGSEGGEGQTLPDPYRSMTRTLGIQAQYGTQPEGAGGWRLSNTIGFGDGGRPRGHHVGYAVIDPVPATQNQVRAGKANRKDGMLDDRGAGKG